MYDVGCGENSDGYVDIWCLFDNELFFDFCVSKMLLVFKFLFFVKWKFD